MFKKMFFYKKVVDLLFPPHCLKCNEDVTEDQNLCVACWLDLRFLVPPWCALCGLSFPFLLSSPSAAILCGACQKSDFSYNQIRSAFVYGKSLSTLLIRFKHGDGTFLAPTLAKWMIQNHRELLAGADWLIPVPLHWCRLLQRQYNQAAILAVEISKLTGVPLCLRLQRRRNTPPQKGKTRNQRQENMKEAFEFTQPFSLLSWLRSSKRRRGGAGASGKEPLKGQCIVLIDDVMTTGATLEACAKILKKAGAKEVRALTVARAR